MNTCPPNSIAMKTRKQCREASQHQREGDDSEECQSGEDDGVLRAEAATTPQTPRAFSSNETAKDSNTIAITEEQLSSLLSNVMRNAMQNAAAMSPVPVPTFSREATPAAPSPSIIGATGNMAKCTARFDGRGSANADRIESFIDAVEMFVECMNISEDHALRGLTMLLTDDAATWWRGIKGNVKTWAEATTRMRAMYGAPRPAYKLLRDIFASEQNDERVETFISRIRATFAKFPYDIDTRLQLDIVYGLLNRKVRKCVPRESVNDVESLLLKARDAEEARIEVGSASARSPRISDNSQIQIPARSLRTTASAAVKPERDVAALITAPSNASEFKLKSSRPRCSYCKSFGHIISECRKVQQESFKTDSSDVRSAVRCYGCNKPGVLRSRCDICNANKSAAPSTADFQSLNTLESIDSSRPLVNVTIAGRQGVAILDTGASQSVASPALHKILVNSGVVFTPTQRTVGLADGSNKVRDILTAQVSVAIGGREALVDFLVFPDSQCRTLLGRDFILNAGIVVNIPQCCFTFQDAANQRFTFVESFQLTTYYSDLMQTDTNSLMLRGDEGHTLSAVERSELNQLICNSEERFATEGPATDFATHHIKVSEGQQPIACQPFRMSQNRRAALKVELGKLLTAGVIEECESPWAANVVMVPKKDGGMRLCIDFRKLNEVTEPDRYPLPRIEDILHAAKTSNYMTTLDLRSGYFQVNVDPSDRDKTCFITPMGTYRFIRMPMGLRNSGATFQRLIDRFKVNLSLESTVLAYLDDIIVLSPDFKTHVKDLQSVFSRLAKFNLRVNRTKSCFACQSVKFLGHVIVPGGIHMDPDKTSAITAMPPPGNVKHLKCFLQTSSWFRRFIPGYADVARPLTNLLKKDSVWCWGEQQQRAFEAIKTLLTTAPILRQADEAQPFVLRTDSSGYCLGAVLMQGEGHDERPIEYASRQLNAAERNYTTTEREALAVVWAVEKFRGYIEGAHVLVKTDHQPLRWLMNTKSPSGRLARWALTLQEFDLRIDYTPGKTNVIADTLSRPPCSQESQSDCELCSAVVDFPARTPIEVRDNQLKDPEVRKIIDDLESDDAPFRGRQWADRGYALSDGILYRYAPNDDDDEDACLVVPEHERAQVMAQYHDAPTAGHLGAERTLRRIAGKFYWPGMRAFVTDYVKRCVACQRYKADNRKPAGLLQTPASARRFEVVSVDLFGPLPETSDGHKWILIVEDVCTRWVELFALRQATSLECAKILTSEIFLRYGVARRMVSDNGVQFVSDIMQQVCHVFGIEQSLTSFYHPSANPIERKNRDLKPQLAILVGREHATWDTHLPAIRFAMNSAVTAGTDHSPAFLTFGRELRAPHDAACDMRAIVERETAVCSVTPYLRRLAGALLHARDTHERAQARHKAYADQHRRPAPDYDPGSLVLLKTQGPNDTSTGQSAKFIPRRDGPYRVREAVGPATYLLERVSDGVLLGKYHTSHLTPFVGDVQPAVREKRRRGRPARYLD